jgi:hypothetical protein
VTRLILAYALLKGLYYAATGYPWTQTFYVDGYGWVRLIMLRR